MDITKSTLMSALQNQMRYLGERQAALSSNIANSDTPGYKAKEIERPDFATLVNGTSTMMPMATTSSAHIVPQARQSQFNLIRDENTFETSPDGNTVNIEDQMMKMSENRLDYEQTVNIYRKMSDLLRTAMKPPGQ